MTTRHRPQTTSPVCYFCKADLQPTPFYSAIDPSHGFPPGVGWRICTPACPERPSTAVVVAR